MKNNYSNQNQKNSIENKMSFSSEANRMCLSSVAYKMCSSSVAEMSLSNKVELSIRNSTFAPPKAAAKLILNSKFLTLIFSILFFLGVSLNGWGQVGNYTFSTGTSGTLNAMTSSTQLVAASSDDVGSAVTNIGFTFVFNNTSYTQFSASSNGLMRLGGTAVGTVYSNGTATSASAWYASTSSLPLIAPYWDDLATGVGGKVHTVITGTAPNRIRIVEWFVTVPRNTGGNAAARFQCWLYESTNVVEFRYGAGMVTNTTNSGASIGIANASSGANNMQSVTVSSNTSSLTTYNPLNTDAIASGRTYTFTPPPAPTISGISPGSGCPGTSLTITGTNFTNASAVSIGGTAATSFSVTNSTTITAIVGAGATGTVQVTTPGGAATSPSTFTVSTAPAAPTASAATAITSTSATANWASVAGATSYRLDVSTSNTFATFVTGYNNLNVGSVTSASITGLTANTTYFYRVRGNNGSCSGVSSGTITFTTPCAAENAPTATETFATFTGSAPNPVCWSEATGAVGAPSTLTIANSEWLNSSGFANTGSNVGVKTNLYSTNPGEWFISNPINLGATAGLYRVSYNMAVTSYNGTTAQSDLGTHIVRVIVSTDGGTTWSSTNTIKTYTGAGTYSNTGQTETVNLTGYSGIVKIAFVATTSSTTPDIDFHLDDFKVELIPACAQTPSNLTASVTSSTTANVSWTAASPAPGSGYEYAVTTSATPPTSGIATTSTSASVTGLLATTTYYLHVRSNCNGTDFSGWVTSASFTTPCNAISSFPWNEGFEGLTSASTTNFPNCWLEGTGTKWRSQNSGTTSYNDPRTGSYYIGCVYGGTNDRIWTPGFQLTSGVSYDFSTYFVGDGYAGWTGDVIYNTSQSATGETTLGSSFITSGTTSTSGTSYAQITRTFVAPSTGVYYFGIRITSSNAPWGSMSFDDFSLALTPACAQTPSGLTASATTSTTANVSWTAASPAPVSGYEYFVSTSTTAPTASTSASGTTAAGVTTANLTGLTANTTYYFWVRSNCGGTDGTSSWVSGGSFFTGYCVPTGATNYFLTNVVTTGGVTNISNATGAGTGGYTNYSSTISCSNYIGALTTITLSSSAADDYYYCWIDWNNDFDFNDANETIFATTAYSNGYTGTITIPAGTAIGNYRMRVANSYSGAITSCGPNAYGEYEDYTFSVVADTSVRSVASGDWNSSSTWNTSVVPTCSDIVVIMTSHTVTVNSAGNISSNLTVNSGGTLVVASGDLTVGCTLNNTPLTNNGTLTTTGGTLNINGNLSSVLGSTFNQSGGNINIDGNNGGSTIGSVASGTPLLNLLQLNSDINWTGGTLTIVDPHTATTDTNGYAVFYNNGTAGTNYPSANHTIQFGNGTSTDAGGHTSGFYINQWNDSAYLPFASVVVAGPSGTNRDVNYAFSPQYVQGNITVNSGGSLFGFDTFNLGGNLIVNSGGSFTLNTINTPGNLTTAILVSNTATTATPGAVSIAQTIGGAGTFRNATTGSNASFTNLTINNTSAGGVTMTAPLSISGTLTMTAGKINTTAINVLTLGTATAAGTLTYTAGLIDGPFRRTYSASGTTSATYNNTTLFPVGVGTTYLPLHLDPVNSAGVVQLTGQAFNTNSGTAGVGVASTLSNDRWEALVTSGSSNLTNCFVGIYDTDIVSGRIITQSASANGTYNTITPTSTFVDAVSPLPNGLRTATSIASASYLGYFTHAAPGPVITSFTPNTACSNQATTITITGTNLSGATSVTLNGEACTITSNTATEIVVTTATPQTGNIVVTTPANSVVSSTTLTVNPSLPASVSVVSDDADNTICAGTSVTFTATPTNGGTTPTYQWFVGTTPVGTNSNTYTSTTLANNDVVTVQMTSNATPCLTGSPATSSGITMTVNPIPTIANAGPDQQVCSTNTITLAANTATTGTGAWSIVSGSGGTITTPSSPTSTFTGTAGTSYTLRWTISNGVCTASSDDVIITILSPLDYVNLQFPGTATICEGNSLTAYGQVYEPGVTTLGVQGSGITVEFGYNTINNDPSTWTSWFGATYNASSVNNNNDEYLYTFTPPSSGTYYYTFRYKQGSCDWQYGGYSSGGGGTWGGSNVNGVLTVNPNATATISGNSGAICNNKTATFTLSGTSGAIVTYTINSGSNQTITLTDGTATVSIPNATANQTLNLVSVSLGSCTASLSGSSTVIVGEVATWNGTSWVGTPGANKGIIFNGNFSSDANLEGCSCTVNSGNVVINSNHTVKLLDEITVTGGSITFRNNSSLLQVNNVTNTGNITYERSSAPGTVLNTDYVYWASPVSGQNVPSTGLNYFWNNAAGTSGNWVNASGQALTAGKGVIMRGVASRNFNGVPFNGEITVAVHRRNIADYNDNWNLIGNPYPSAISAEEFLRDLDNTAIEGSIAIWTHGSEISNSITTQPFYGNFTYNYNPNDYIIYNLTGPQSGIETYQGFIPAGQGFFVKYDNDDNASPTAASSTIKFKNSMRSDASGNAYNNTQFYRNSGNVSQNLEKSRIWIDIINSSSASYRTVVGYIQSATDSKDRLFDAATSVTASTTSIYSLIGNDKMCIQGKGLPFNNSDIIPLGFNAAQAGNLTIAIHALDGLFVNQEVYLLDTQLNITHNIKLTPYTFTAVQGENNTRFRLIFNNGTLSNPDFDAERGVIIVNKDKLKVISNVEEMESITVFDLLGRTIYMNNNINSREFVIPVSQERAPLIVKIKLANGIYVERKTMY